MRPRLLRHLRSQTGQATAEYALVMVAAAAFTTTTPPGSYRVKVPADGATTSPAGYRTSHVTRLSLPRSKRRGPVCGWV